MNSEASASAPPRPALTRSLFGKYVTLFVTVVCAALLSAGLIEAWYAYREQTDALARIQREQAKAAAAEINHYFKELTDQIGWVMHLPWSAGLEQRRFDVRRLLRQSPPVTEVALYDASGRERLRMSRVAADVVDGGADISKERSFIDATANRVHYGPVYFRRGSEPFMAIAMSGARADAGVAVAEVNLKHILDVLSEIKVGETGRAYVVDAQGLLVGHPDISAVLRRIDMSSFPHVAAARNGTFDQAAGQVTRDLKGDYVFTAFAPIGSLGWLVFVELPIAEAYAPLYAGLWRSALTLVAALVLAVLAGLLLARRMVRPIRALISGAERIGSGDLGQRLAIRTGDELEVLGDRFNTMAARLQESYATLERKVEERTRQLELANQAKSRFLAAASHDLRQPLHALGLFVEQLHAPLKAAERERVVERIDTAVGAMGELFDALLDISRLDAGVLSANKTEFPLARLLARIETNFAGPAREKGLELRIVPTTAWVRSDFILLERVLINLVSNAIRYTASGGVVVGCRRRGESVRVEVWDSGAGIAPEQQRNIFGEFYQVPGDGRERQGGLGLGLAIVDRLCSLLSHGVELASVPGKGSRFSVLVPVVAASRATGDEAPRPASPVIGIPPGTLIVVIDDDQLVREGMGGLLRSWGAEVVAGDAVAAVRTGLAEQGRAPDLIISDYHLMNGSTGIAAIDELRAAHGPVPAFLISGDIAPDRLREARARGYHLLHKPVAPMALRGVVHQLLKRPAAVVAA